MASTIDQLQQKAPELVTGRSLAKSVMEKHNLGHHNARVALCLDISGTMYSHYMSGRLQTLAERTLALASLLDDNAHLDIFLFGDRAYYAGEMNLDNLKDFIRSVHKKYTSVGGTFFGKTLKYIRNFYYPHDGEGIRHTIVKDNTPVYVMVVTDGTTLDEKETTQQLIWGAYEPIFWQFIALGKSKEEYKGIWGWFNKPFAEDFSFLKQIDIMDNRNIDNANFFNLEHPLAVSETEFYELMMIEYPLWLKEAKKLGMLVDTV